MTAYVLYRRTTLGTALEQTLSDMQEEGLIPTQLCGKIMSQFDKSMHRALERIAKEKTIFMAEQLLAYRFCDNVWTFILRDVSFKDPQRSIENPIDKLKIVACDGRQNAMLASTLHSGPPSKKPTIVNRNMKQDHNDDDDSD
ncbi:unnamed protein product [Caenorhabditis angaria]|uniref:Transcription initiation factor IIA subunit 2 n=1 Tax=Caenorhabditis angaria TaxID=860376 RepID=A0A9P1IIJ6_9PELO|nr:unnamed protein product [Caenorhabditis angaria]